ncbi:hypothetical protein MYOV056v2_p0146 [Vibrio phage 184E37.3a]|nr:hypothetical protein MYOV056v2_p0146 [Vibrio phage 184E37.3a]QZI90161.1 hypothetical protein MYOV057v1_p0246 [Vibrio phage 184E37.1]
MDYEPAKEYGQLTTQEFDGRVYDGINP